MMPNHHTLCPSAGDRQHSGLGNPPEAIDSQTSQSLYAQAAREYARMLTLKGNNYDQNRHGGSNPLAWDVLLSEIDGRDRVLCSREGLFESGINETRSAGPVHSSTDEGSGEESGSGERGSNSRVSKLERRVLLPIILSLLTGMFLGWNAGHLFSYILKIAVSQ
jgi:hypothetical protein